MKEKSETENHLKRFINLIRTQFGKLVEVVRSDNGLEFKSKPLREFMINMELYARLVVSILLNKMVGWRENTSIS